MLRATLALTVACLLLHSSPANGAKVLKATKDTVHWGFFSKNLSPKLEIESGEEVEVEMLNHHSGDDPELMIEGDKNVEEIWKWGPKGPGNDIETAMRGATGSGDGVHVLTGPIKVNGAKPGDILKVEILELTPRPNKDGDTYGVNAAAWWGFHYGVNGNEQIKNVLKKVSNSDKPGVGSTTPADGTTPAGVKPHPFEGTVSRTREVTNVYKVVKAYDGPGNLVPAYAEPVYQAVYGGSNGDALVTDCVDWGDKPTPTASWWPNCTNGKQTWGNSYQFPGLMQDTTKITKDTSVAGKFRVPVNMHIGCMGLAPSEENAVNSIPPMPYGGNLDNRKIGVGATMYYPVAVEGALLSMGDTHFAQGDGELDGTAIEMSLNGKFRISVIKAKSTEAQHMEALDFPLLENANEYVVHGFSFQNYMLETFTGSIGVFGHSNIDGAMANAYRNSLRLLMNKGFTEDQAITILSTTSDFAITQVVDGNWGVHCTIPKFSINEIDTGKSFYTPYTITGSSLRTTMAASGVRALPSFVGAMVLPALALVFVF